MTESIYAAAVRIAAEEREAKAKKEAVAQTKFENELKKVKGLPVDAQIDALLDFHEAE